MYTGAHVCRDSADGACEICVSNNANENAKLYASVYLKCSARVKIYQKVSNQFRIDRTMYLDRFTYITCMNWRSLLCSAAAGRCVFQARVFIIVEVSLESNT